jgi:hypothetical protein
LENSASGGKKRFYTGMLRCACSMFMSLSILQRLTTVLGPCLFLVHLIGISSNISPETSASSFADDTRLQRGISDKKDCELLQEDLDKVYTWAEDIGMMFNAGKFELLRFWVDRESAPDILFMAPDGGPIEEKDSLRDLGVRVSTDLSFSAQT